MFITFLLCVFLFVSFSPLILPSIILIEHSYDTTLSPHWALNYTSLKKKLLVVVKEFAICILN